MKKILCLLFMFLFSGFRVFASDIKFVQIDNLKYSPSSEISVQAFTDTIQEINKLKGVDFVVFTGNNIARSDKKYLISFLRKANKLNKPYYVALGHKDLHKKKGLSKEAYISILRTHTYKNIRNTNYKFTKKGVVFIVVDGAKEFIATPFGYYRDNAIDYVDKELSRYRKHNAVILQHFPLYPPNTEDEGFKTYNAENYIKMLAKHTNVKMVVSGFNVNTEKDINGVKYITTAGFPKYRIIELIDCGSESPAIWSTLK